MDGQFEYALARHLDGFTVLLGDAPGAGQPLPLLGPDDRRGPDTRADETLLVEVRNYVDAAEQAFGEDRRRSFLYKIGRMCHERPPCQWSFFCRLLRPFGLSMGGEAVAKVRAVLDTGCFLGWFPHRRKRIRPGCGAAPSDSLFSETAAGLRIAHLASSPSSEGPRRFAFKNDAWPPGGVDSSEVAVLSRPHLNFDRHMRSVCWHHTIARILRAFSTSPFT